MNEATFEAYISSEIQKHFPFLCKNDITHQKTFSVKFGHQDINVSNKYVKGRLDILVNYKDKPLAILELKAPGVKLHEDDVNQAVSYARLLEPMAPLAVISNGSDTWIYNTYDKSKFDNNKIDNSTIKELFSYTAQFAATEIDQAIQVLLGQNPELWEDILANISDSAFDNHKGEIENLLSPICDKFQIERDIVDDLLERVKICPLITLTGKPFSGKTNVAYQLYKKRETNMFPIYFDVSNTSGIIQHLSNQLSHLLFSSITPNDIRNWLINSLCRQTSNRIVFIIDNIMSSSDDIWKEIQELTSINFKGSFSVLLIVNDQIYEEKRKIKGKSTLSPIGRAPCIILTPLSDDEFEETILKLDSNYKMQFHEGGQFNAEYRNPRLLRIIVSQMIANINEESVLLLPSITTHAFLLSIWEQTNEELRSDYRYFAEAVIEQNIDSNYDPFICLMAYNSGITTFKSAKSFLGEHKINNLISLGYIKTMFLDNGDIYLLPLLPEVVSVAAAFAIFEKMVNLYSNNNDDLYSYLLKATQLFPIPDLTAVLAVIFACEHDPYFISRIITKLIEDNPVIEKNGATRKILIKTVKGIKEVDLSLLKIDEDESGVTLSNYYPWLFLSSMASIPLGDDSANIDTWLSILAIVGSFEDVLFRVENHPIELMKEFHVHEQINGTRLLCGKMGIIEPITQAMQNGFVRCPQQMLGLVNWACENGNDQLKMRLQVAANSLKDIKDENIRIYSRKAQEILSSCFLKQ